MQSDTSIGSLIPRILPRGNEAEEHPVATKVAGVPAIIDK
jgi:hypothetical protein